MIFKVFILFVSLFLLPSSLFANEEGNSTSISVTPAIIEGAFDPGKEKTMEVTLFNFSSITLPIKAYTIQFLSNEEIDSSMRYILDASDWFEINPPEFILHPNSHEDVKIRVSVPEDADPGGHYATIIFEPLLNPDSNKSYLANVVGRVSVLSFLKVSGHIVEDIQTVELKYPKLKQFFPVEMELVLRNNGNIHLLPDTRVTVSNVFTKQTASFSTIPSVIIPGTKKTYTFSLSGEELAFGKYKGVVEYNYGSIERKTYDSEISFWVVPVYWIISVLLVLTTIILLYIIYKERLLSAFRVLFGMRSDI